MSATGRVLVDTSAWVETLRPDGDPAVRAAVSRAADDGRAVLCDMVLLELWNGAGDPREERLLRKLERLAPRVPTTARGLGQGKGPGAGVPQGGADPPRGRPSHRRLRPGSSSRTSSTATPTSTGWRPLGAGR